MKNMLSNSNIIAIVGRPNVGKSTLFNRLVGMRKAIVDPTSGTTRDRHYGKGEWNGKLFSVIDTGGMTSNSDDIFEQEINKQVVLAIEEADVIIFMVDVSSGITDYDENIANLLRRTKKKTILVVNKVDNVENNYDAMEFYSLGFELTFMLSSVSGTGTGELLDEVVTDFTIPEEEYKEPEFPKIAIVGKPNVGKSSFVNMLLGDDRNIVTPIAGTTRDSILTHFTKFGFEFDLIDTAGLRKKGKVTEDLEFYSVLRAVRTIENADVCVLMIDATLGMEAQDMSIFNLIEKNKKGCIVAVNKWDLIEDKETNSMKDFRDKILERMAPFNDVPVIFTSVKDKERLLSVIDKAMEVDKNRRQRIPTAKLNDFLLPLIESRPPPAIKGKYIKIKYVTQLPTYTPSFVLFANLPQYIKDPYKRFLENRMREEYNFTGVPLQIFFRPK